MKFSSILTLLIASVEISAVAVPEPASDVAHFQPAERDSHTESEDLWKRKGGGGGGGRGGGGSSSGGSSGGSGSSGSSGSSGASGAGRGGAGSSAGGATRQGSGPPPAYGGGNFYGGGARQPYQSGQRSPSGISPVLLGAGVGGLAFLAFWPGIWYHPVHYYPYTHPYNYHNSSSNQNETRNVACGCDSTVECGCDDNNSTEFLNDVVGNGSYQGLNKSLVTVAKVNGTDTILINGTLPNGTTVDGGDEDAFGSGGMAMLMRNVGWWPVVATVCAAVFLA